MCIRDRSKVVEDSVTTAKDQASTREWCVSKPNSRLKIVLVSRYVSCVGSILTRDQHLARCWIKIRDAIVGICLWSYQIVCETKIDGQLSTNLPIVLDISTIVLPAITKNLAAKYIRASQAGRQSK